jgi:hypothetical protein
MLCKYSKLLGEPGKGAHSLRICNIAVVDVLLTALVAWLLGWWLDKSIICIFVILLLIGIILHRVFAVNTTVNKAIYGDIKCTE